MKSDFPAIWAESPASLRREPTPAELAGGFPCGPLDLPLFNELAHRLAQVYAESAHAITASGQTLNANNRTQLWQAILRAIEDNAPGAASTTINNLSIVGGRVVFFPAPGAFTWVAPAGVERIRLTLQGGGGGGGGGNSFAGGGGAGGNAAQGVFPVTAGVTYAGLVGAGGAAGPATGAGGNGGTTSFGPQGGSALYIAGGGGGGTPGGNPGTGNVGIAGARSPLTSAPFPRGGLEFLGGEAQNGIDFLNGFTGGIGGGSRHAPTTAFPFGFGAYAGAAYGGGGSGGAGTSVGGVGAAGFVIIEY